MIYSSIVTVGEVKQIGFSLIANAEIEKINVSDAARTFIDTPNFGSCFIRAWNFFV
jgi:hypothetical protein